MNLNCSSTKLVNVEELKPNNQLHEKKNEILIKLTRIIKSFDNYKIRDMPRPRPRQMGLFMFRLFTQHKNTFKLWNKD